VIANRIAVIGCGIMGRAMAHNLVCAGFDVRVWNRSRTRVAEMHSLGFAKTAYIATTAAEAVESAEFILTMLSDGAATMEVMAGPEGALARVDQGAVWLQMSTVGANATHDLHELAKSRSVYYIDAPVLGTREPAERGELTVLASGDRSLRDRCSAPFEAVGKRTLWLDEVGDSSRLKLVANQWSTGMVALIAETSKLARAIGVELEQFLSLVDSGPFMAGYAATKATMMAARDYEPCFPLDMAHKDVRLALEMAEAAGCALPITTTIARQYERAERAGHGRHDLSAVVEVRDEG